ncbi:rhomboid family intramembrane serine protease [Uliginosibacterium sp. 31-16]|uniref:rhomboid family intramembrane serine protease n=1 Tax=Uliginosibacterium sp. 31-16 TaxID=3068315 RepID=UPI00273DCDAC|nr:rhomboid family intramembrane serine protease [Uliginosibacterium sp. 31-16]MDP5240353.1 rhomboid family intramembrane serine protease [Uliginosibacterium sp. 31-16]
MPFPFLVRRAFPTVRKSSGSAWLAVGVLGCLGLGVLLIGLIPAVEGSLYFHPGQDPLWRGLLAQLVHVNLAHMVLNLVTLLGVGGMALAIGRLWGLLACLMLSALAVCFGLQAEQPPLAWYAGLSGALYGAGAWLPLAVAERAASRSIQALAVLICLAIGAKAWLSLSAGGLLAGVSVASSSHVYGYLGGLCYAVFRGVPVIYRRWHMRGDVTDQ